MTPVIYALMWTMVQATTNYKIQEMEESPGIFYERIDDIRYTKTRWRIVVFWDKNTNRFDETHFQGTLGRIRAGCKEERFPGQCRALQLTSDHIKEGIKRVGREYRALSEIIENLEGEGESTHGEKTVRKRSAPMGFVEGLTQWLLGVMEESDKQAIQGQVEQLKTRQLTMAKWTKDQLHVVEARSTRTEKQMREIQDRMTSIAAQVNTTWEIIKDLSEGWEVLQIVARTLGGSQAIATEIGSLRDIYRQTALVIREAKRGRLHESLLSAADIRRIITEVNMGRQDAEFPITPEKASIDKIAQISDVRVAAKDGIVIIEITVPLTEKIAVEVYRIHPVFVPQKHWAWKKAMAKIQTAKDIIAIDTNKREYTFLSEPELMRCRRNAAERNLICIHDTPFMDGYTVPSCEYSLLVEPNLPNLKKCPVTTKKEQENTFTRLRTLDAWLYSTSGQTRVEVVCDPQDRQVAHVKGVGILQIQPGCTAIVGGTRLWGSPIIETKPPQYLSPKISLDIAPPEENPTNPKPSSLRDTDGSFRRDIMVQATAWSALVSLILMGLSTFAQIYVGKFQQRNNAARKTETEGEEWNELVRPQAKERTLGEPMDPLLRVINTQTTRSDTVYPL